MAMKALRKGQSRGSGPGQERVCWITVVVESPPEGSGLEITELALLEHLYGLSPGSLVLLVALAVVLMVLVPVRGPAELWTAEVRSSGES